MAIRKITLTSGATTYEAVLDGPRDGSTGKRKQLRRRFKTRREAAAWEAESKTTISAGTFVGRDRTTIADYLRGWTAGRTDVKPATRQNYQDALQVPLAAFGGRPLQDLSKSDVDRMVAGMLDGSLRRVGRAGEPLSPRAVRLTLTVLAMAMDAAVAEGRLTRNVARLVARPRQVRAQRAVWEAREAGAFLMVADQDRLAGAWRLSLHGLRRGEVLGLGWADVDLEVGLVRVHRSRVAVGGRSVVQDTKSVAGERVVPLSPDAVAALRRTRAQQLAERLAAGSAYSDAGMVAVDALGAPVAPRWYADRFKALSREAGLPAVRLHDARHAYGSYLLDRGVPLPIVSQVMGHASVDVTASVYAHALKDGADDRVRQALVAAGL